MSHLDTRAKIIAPAQARELIRDQPTAWVAGYFDPLLAEHIRLLEQCKSRARILVVEVDNPAKPLLAQRARAELVAALAMVDYVVLRDGDSSGWPPVDAGITERFIEHVLDRHRQEQAR